MLRWCGIKRGDDTEAVKRNADIEKDIRKDKKAREKNIKMLLLGAGEGGKSTVLKQMKLIYADGFTDTERKEYRQLIFSNLIIAFTALGDEMRELKINYQMEESMNAELLLRTAADISVNETFPAVFLRPMETLWSDPAIHQTMAIGTEFALHDNIAYYCQHLPRLFAKDYIPVDQDILRSRLRTTGITETTFELDTMTYHMFDVGGQRSERKKWVHCFEGVQCLLFVASLSGYDQSLVEDKSANQMQEALMLFESVLALKWFRKSSIILFLNKMDLFMQKLSDKPIRDHFPDYTGADDDVEAAKSYFANKFRGLNRDDRREIYVHYTTATDTNLLRVTMKSVQDIVVRKNLNKYIFGNPDVVHQQRGMQK